MEADMSNTLSRRSALGAVAAVAVGALARGDVHADEKRPKIKVGQMGVGHAHASKLSVYRASPDYEVVGIVEPNKELREQAQEQAAFRDVPFVTEEQLLNTAG